MALFSMLRRPTYSALALAARAVGSARTFHRAISTVPTFSGDHSPRSSFPTQRFSTATATATATATELIGNESLIGGLESEIKCTQERKIKIPEVPDEFPFEIIDIPGEKTILLKRQFQGETIQVGVDAPHVFPADEDSDEYENDDPGIPMVVSVSKENGMQLEFGVTGFEEDVSIDSLSIVHPDHSPEQFPYDGPEFHELDEGLQNAFYKYLEARGIQCSMTIFLTDYMRKKDNKEYLLWLKNLKAYVEQ
ncbi:unnamed protein product [Prunus armeniaca]|uniref:Mitochondrial glycoprotein family protein n=1 Tax=Prunus armeniaca TaxID=36596 RepID=A0A6J5XT84_PRUAR|nr:hypothetical protein GBA52_019257 [Prunus armeniaca]CAB4315005.1 unnamed protein product [Prunus armeniaca]